MKILLSPSETKITGGTDAPFCKANFCLPDCFASRESVFQTYNQFLQTTTLEELSAWFGLKKHDEAQKLQRGIADFPTMKAIERYTGVAFSALSYSSLSPEAQAYLDENLLLFSNLFGPIKAGDRIPDYKFKQGQKLNGEALETYFKKHFTEALEQTLGDEILDLRAGFHEKQYKPKRAKVLKLKFIKQGKVVSHWSKHYRGLIAREVAKNNVQNFEEFFQQEFSGLSLGNVQHKANTEEAEMHIQD